MNQFTDLTIHLECYILCERKGLQYPLQKELNSCPRGTYSFLSFLVLALLDKTVSLISISLILSLACTFRVLVFPNIGQQLQKREID